MKFFKKEIIGKLNLHIKSIISKTILYLMNYLKINNLIKENDPTLKLDN